MRELIKELDEKGLLNRCIQAGLIRGKARLYIDIYAFYHQRIEQGDAPTDTAEATAAAFNCDISTVYRALKAMK